jgi:8-oxo-dGTP diphosphatase
VIRDARGRILLARRTEGRDLAGLWEFPGGKREPGESEDEALARELQEELGIDARIGAPLIAVPQTYPDKHLVLDVRLVDAWQGPARGREGQALAWVPEDRLTRYAMPPADRPVVAALREPAHYVVTPAPGDVDDWDSVLDDIVAAGARRVQLRGGVPGDPSWRRRVEAAATRCRGADVDVLVNGDIDLARALGIGVHLKSVQLAALDARPLAPGLPVAASCHGAADLQHAERLGCDFAVLGHVAETPSHPGVPPLGWEGFAALRAQASLPIYGIGGLGPADLGQARAHGAQGIAGIRAFQIARDRGD